MRSRVLTVLVAAACCALAPAAHGQDAQYWTQKYGTSALLLNGAVIGSGVDLSTTFYNPGGLVFLRDSSSVLAVKALDFSSVSIQDATGTGEDISEPRNSVAPTFFGGTVPIRILGSVPLAYSFFPRQLAQFNLTAQSIRPIDLLAQSPGPEDVVIEGRFEEDLTENWAGATWARRVGPRVGIGLSQFIAFRSQRLRRQFMVQALANDSTGGSFTDISGFTYNDARTVTKVGLSIEFSRVKLGLTATSPSIHLWGSGTAGKDRALIGLDVDGDGTPDDELTATYQDGIPFEYKSPFAIGAGVAFDLGNTILHASAESFDGVDRYAAFQTDPAISFGTGSPVPFNLYHEFESVLNYGVGIEHSLGPRSEGFVSFSTDYSADPHGKTDLAIGDWDSYLATAGVTFPLLHSEFTLGLGYGWGSGEADRIARLGDLVDQSGLSPLSATFDEAKTQYRNFRVIFGFTI